MKIKVGVIFGGKSVEHEISIISALQAIQSLNPEKYDVIPIYVTKNNEFYTGYAVGDIAYYRGDIKELLKISQRVLLVSDENRVKLIAYPIKRFSKGYVDYILVNAWRSLKRRALVRRRYGQICDENRPQRQRHPGARLQGLHRQPVRFRQ